MESNVFNWNCKHSWKKSAKNTMWCVVGCSIGDLGTILFFQLTQIPFPIAGIMILAIINGDTADIIRENNLGLCVDPSNVELICTTFQDCIDMTEVERISFVKNNEEVLDTIFNKENIINDLTKILVQK
jgi:hypothetical protein